MARVIAICNQKGGVGKTTTAINLGASLAVMEKKVLILDADSQANATSGLGFDVREVKNTIYECLVEDLDPQQAVQKCELDNLYLLPSHVNLAGAEVELINMTDREKVMKGVVDKLRDQFDYIIIDCMPSLALITVNALVAADSVLIPVQCEYFALEGLGSLLRTIKKVEKKLHPSIEIEGFLLTMFDQRTILSNQVRDEVRTNFRDMVFNTVIVRNVRLSEAPSHGKDVISYDASSKGATAYMELAREIIAKHSK